MPPDIRQVNIQRYNDRRFRAYCCGFIDSSANDIIICFFWAAISFYFAVLAFLQKSPFYSYVQTVPLVVFGAVNLLFGVVTLCGIVLLLLRARIDVRIIGMYQSRKTVFAITANAIAVLIVTLVNFILFVMNKSGFFNWCINSAKDAVTDINSNSTIPLENGIDNYNCQRLYQDEIKWSFLCFAVMSVVYIHWILIITARTTYQFFNRVEIPQPMPTEYANLSSSIKKQLYKNEKPSRSLWKSLLTHEQYSNGNTAQGTDDIREKITENELINFPRNNTYSSNV
ncbi:unnamed protein product [Rhizopus stolonifer]